MSFKQMDEPQQSHRTRSKAAPGWTVEESLILVNEITVVESEWGATLPSFQKWRQIVENCNALDVNRNLNQCKSKWDALLSAYRRVNQGAPPDRSFPAELFSAVDCCVTSKEKMNGGGGEAEDDDDDDDGVDEAAVKEEQVAMETDQDSDPEAQGNVPNFFVEAGSSRQRSRMKRQKRRVETKNPWGYFTSTLTSTKIKHEESISIKEEVDNTDNSVESMPEEISTDSQQEQILATTLWKTSMQINAILEGNDVDCKLEDLKNAEAVQVDLTRRHGDKLIDCLAKISTTLNQLCDVVQKCNDHSILS